MPDRYGDEPTTGDPDYDVRVARDLRARAIDNCGLCDNDGYRGTQVCAHWDYAAAAKRGMAMIREAMKWH